MVQAERTVMQVNVPVAQATGPAKATGDTPACTTCGHVTIRNGTCFKCLNCGESLGCS